MLYRQGGPLSIWGLGRSWAKEQHIFCVWPSSGVTCRPLQFTKHLHVPPQWLSKVTPPSGSYLALYRRQKWNSGKWINMPYPPTPNAHTFTKPTQSEGVVKPKTEISLGQWQKVLAMPRWSTFWLWFSLILCSAAFSFEEVWLRAWGIGREDWCQVSLLFIQQTFIGQLLCVQ